MSYFSEVASVFSDDFPLVTTNEELALQINAKTDCDLSYVSSGCIEERKRKIDALWPAFKPYADKEFLKGIRVNFDQRCWEMYLANIFTDHFDISSSVKNHGPDYVLDDRICVEAIACKRGESPNGVPELYITNPTEDKLLFVDTIPEDKMILRITHAIHEKYAQYSRWLSSLTSVNEKSPLVIAVNTGGLGFPSPGDLPLVLKPLFGIGHRQFRKEAGRLVDSGWSGRPTISKNNGTQIDACFFEDQKYAAISAVLFSETRTLDHSSHIGEDCIVVHNPNAKNPIDQKVFSFLDQWIEAGESIVHRPAEINQTF
ncbi:MAG: hypothetical protein AAB467_01410 [Patescibacteria group bacterium]